MLVSFEETNVYILGEIDPDPEMSCGSATNRDLSQNKECHRFWRTVELIWTMSLDPGKTYQTWI